jgi:hypothetical protein
MSASASNVKLKDWREVEVAIFVFYAPDTFSCSCLMRCGCMMRLCLRRERKHESQSVRLSQWLYRVGWRRVHQIPPCAMMRPEETHKVKARAYNADIFICSLVVQLYTNTSC